jgi:serine/threonine protein kinase
MFAAEEALVGTIVDGRYALEEIVGRGGMGVVYRGEHVSMRRLVAVKVLLSNLAGVPELRSRFEREAIAVGRIDHANCVGVFDVGSMPDGSLYLVMEFLEGEALGDVLQRETLFDPLRAMHILTHVLRGLEHIHAAGIVHRDIKLDNIHLVHHDGDTDFAKILDFGIAKTIGATEHDEVKLTQAGIAFGTPLYMAPEQALGNPIDGRADLYAASVMAYELLTGRPPFYSDDKIELLSMHTTREPPPMRERMPKGARPVPAAIEALVRRGLAKRPADRIPSASEYLAQITEALATTSPLGGAPHHVSSGATGAHPLVTMTGSSVIAGEHGATTDPAAIDLLPGVPKTGAARIPIAPPPPPPKLRSIWTYVLGLLVAAGVGVGIAVMTARQSKPPAGPIKPAADTPAGAAARELENGNPLRAIQILDDAGAAIADDPLAQLQLGHALAATRANERALVAYGQALTLTPSLEADLALRANLAAMTNDKDAATVTGAFELLVTRTKIAEASDRLVATATDSDMDRRAAVRPLIEKLGLSDQVDWVDPLTKAMTRKGGKRNSKLVNQCLVDDAAAALTYLRGLTAPAPAPEP